MGPLSGLANGATFSLYYQNDTKNPRADHQDFCHLFHRGDGREFGRLKPLAVNLNRTIQLYVFTDDTSSIRARYRASTSGTTSGAGAEYGR